MKKQLHLGKRIIALAMSALMAFSGTEVIPAETTKVQYFSETVNLGELRELSGNLNTTDESDSSVALKQGNYVRWIDRLDIPQELYDFYAVLEEAVDNDGVEDILISELEDGSFISVLTVQQATEMSETKMDYIYNCIRAVIDAFDRDHPEVFWLSGETMAGCSGTIETYGNTTTYTYQFNLFLKNAENAYDIRTKAYTSEEAIRNGIESRDGYINAILDATWAEENSTIDTVNNINAWLTLANQYNTSADLNRIDASCRKCMSALSGQAGTLGPVCEGYARAFKVLCDKVGIPCVLVDGEAVTSADAAGEAHMWNYVKVGESWYGVDVTWNDPLGGEDGVESGLENTDYLLVSADTMIGDMTFIESHPVTNQASVNGVTFTNGPKLGEAKDLVVWELPKLSGVYGQLVGELKFTTDDAYVGDLLGNQISGTWSVHAEDVELLLEANTQENVKVIFTPDDAELEIVMASVCPQIDRKDLLDDDILVCMDNHSVYDGTYQEPLVEIFYDKNNDNAYTKECDLLLEQNKDYLLTYENNVNATLNDATITIQGLENYQNTVICTFSIEKADKAPNMPEASMEVSPNIAKVADVELPETWIWQEEDKEKLLVVDEAVTATAIYNGADKGNYEIESIVISIICKNCVHNYGEPVFNWSADGKRCTVVFTCQNNAAHTNIQEATVTSKVKTEATDKNKGVTTYTATYTDGNKTYIDTKDIADIPVLEKEPTPEPKPSPDPTPDAEQTPNLQEGILAVGTVITDDSGKATYKVTTSGLTDGTVTYVKATNKKVKSISIPATVVIKGVTYKVTGIAKNACKNNKYIKKLTIGSNVKNIGASAFFKCKNLNTIIVKTKLLKKGMIAKNAFKGIKTNATIKIPKKQFKAYKSILIKSGVSKKAKLKKA